MKGGWRVWWGGKIKAKRTTRAKGRALLRLLRAKEHGWSPGRRKVRR